MKPNIRNCKIGYKCDKNWHDLEKTNDENIRLCLTCNNNVHHVLTQRELAQRIEKKQCVYFDLSLLEEHITGTFVGEPSAEATALYHIATR